MSYTRSNHNNNSNYYNPNSPKPSSSLNVEELNEKNKLYFSVFDNMFDQFRESCVEIRKIYDESRSIVLNQIKNANEALDSIDKNDPTLLMKRRTIHDDLSAYQDNLRNLLTKFNDQIEALTNEINRTMSMRDRRYKQSQIIKRQRDGSVSKTTVPRFTPYSKSGKPPTDSIDVDQETEDGSY